MARLILLATLLVLPGCATTAPPCLDLKVQLCPVRQP